MAGVRYLPPVSVCFAIGRLFTGRVSFQGARVGKILTMDDGESQVVFREVQVASSRSVPAGSLTVLKVRFKFSRFSPAANRRLSLIPIPVIIGMPGFRQKTWTFSEETGYSQGIYQFESMEEADRYKNSLVMKVLEKRSVPGSTTFELFPDTLVKDFLSNRLER